MDSRFLESNWNVGRKYKLLKDHADDNLEDHDMAMSSDSIMILLMKMKKLSLLMMWLMGGFRRFFFGQFIAQKQYKGKFHRYIPNFKVDEIVKMLPNLEMVLLHF